MPDNIMAPIEQALSGIEKKKINKFDFGKMMACGMKGGTYNMETGECDGIPTRPEGSLNLIIHRNNPIAWQPEGLIELVAFPYWQLFPKLIWEDKEDIHGGWEEYAGVMDIDGQMLIAAKGPRGSTQFVPLTGDNYAPYGTHSPDLFSPYNGKDWTCYAFGGLEPTEFIGAVFFCGLLEADPTGGEDKVRDFLAASFSYKAIYTQT